MISKQRQCLFLLNRGALRFFPLESTFNINNSLEQLNNFEYKKNSLNADGEIKATLASRLLSLDVSLSWKFETFFYRRRLICLSNAFHKAIKTQSISFIERSYQPIPPTDFNNVRSTLAHNFDDSNYQQQNLLVQVLSIF